MGAKTGISWTGSTWSCLRGCSRTIAKGATQSGCGDPSGGGCYAERDGYRFSGPGLPYEGLVRMTAKGARWTGKVKLVDKHLLDPVRWKRPRKIFTTSVSDPFHERFSNETIALLVGVMAVTRRHTHQMLTKRVARARQWFAWVAKEAAAEDLTPAAFCFSLLRKYVADAARFSDHERKLLDKMEVVGEAASAPWPLPNLWLGTSTENQPAADERIPDLMACPAAIHFLSIEPLIGPIDLRLHLAGATALRTFRDHGGTDVAGIPRHLRPPPSPSWIIVGAESGPGSRPCSVDWVRLIRHQCERANVPLFVKQLFASIEVDEGPGSKAKGARGDLIELPYLDGIQHASFPEVTHV